MKHKYYAWILPFVVVWGHAYIDCLKIIPKCYASALFASAVVVGVVAIAFAYYCFENDE